MDKFLSKISILFCLAISFSLHSKDMYFVTVADTEHFPWVKDLLESILKYNYTKVSKIAVFNLGLTQSEIDQLNKMPFVEVYEIEDVNPEMRKKFVVRTNGRLARGWYSWKPTVFYQALKLFPHFLYVDAGIEVVAPLDTIFDEIKQNGYYLFDSPFLLFPFVTDHVMQLFKLDNEENRWILEENCISAGLQGISRSLLESYVTPIYQLAADIKNFEDNGTAPWGYGFARHDQTLFSIFVRKLHLKTHPLFCNPKKMRMGDHKIYFGGLKYFKLRQHAAKEVKHFEDAKKHNLLG